MLPNISGRMGSTCVCLAFAVLVSTPRSVAGQNDTRGQPTPAPVALDQLGESARQQIRAIGADKQRRSVAQRKISSRLLYAAKARSGARIAANVGALRSQVAVAPDGRVDVEIHGRFSKAVIETIEKFGGEVLYGHERASTLRALVPIELLEGLAELSEVRGISPTAMAKTHRQLRERSAPAALSRPGRRGPSSEQVETLRSRLLAAIDQIGVRRTALQDVPPQLAIQGAATTQGDVAHRAAEARNFFGVTGAGVNIGVLSDSVRFLEQSQASGDLPNDVTVLPGQSGIDPTPPFVDIGEGTAMLEIIHDLAPGAKLFFATAFNSAQSFADNIRALRAAGCHIIVDDVFTTTSRRFRTASLRRR